MAIHDNGDTTSNCANVGAVFNPLKEVPPQGYFGSFNSNDQGKISAQIYDFPLVLHDPSGSDTDRSVLNRACVIHKLVSKCPPKSSQTGAEFEIVKLDCAPLKEVEEPIAEEE